MMPSIRPKISFNPVSRSWVTMDLASFWPGDNRIRVFSRSRPWSWGPSKWIVWPLVFSAFSSPFFLASERTYCSDSSEPSRTVTLAGLHSSIYFFTIETTCSLFSASNFSRLASSKIDSEMPILKTPPSYAMWLTPDILTSIKNIFEQWKDRLFFYGREGDAQKVSGGDHAGVIPVQQLFPDLLRVNAFSDPDAHEIAGIERQRCKAFRIFRMRFQHAFNFLVPGFQQFVFLLLLRSIRGRIIRA